MIHHTNLRDTGEESELLAESKPSPVLSVFAFIWFGYLFCFENIFLGQLHPYR